MIHVTRVRTARKPGYYTIRVPLPFPSRRLVLTFAVLGLGACWSWGGDGFTSSDAGPPGRSTPGRSSYGICPGNATFDQVVGTVSNYADLVLGAPQLQDPTRPCDAISVGMGIEMVPASPPTVVVPRPKVTSGSDCSPTDAGAGG